MMTLNPMEWRFNADKTALLNLSDGRMITRQTDEDAICYAFTFQNSKLMMFLVKDRGYVPSNALQDHCFIDDELFNRLGRIFDKGFDYSDYNF